MSAAPGRPKQANLPAGERLRYTAAQGRTSAAARLFQGPRAGRVGVAALRPARRDRAQRKAAPMSLPLAPPYRRKPVSTV